MPHHDTKKKKKRTLTNVRLKKIKIFFFEAHLRNGGGGKDLQKKER